MDATLDTNEQSEVDTAWAELSDQRIAEIETGQITLISKNTILQQIRDRPKTSHPLPDPHAHQPTSTPLQITLL